MAVAATAAGGAFATCDAYARFVQLLLARGAPLLAPETFADLAEVQFPGLAGGIESFQTWDVADWGLGCDIRDAKEPHWPSRACSPATLSHFGAAGTLMWADPGRARRPRVPRQPGHVLGLDDAARRLARSVRRRPRRVA